MPIQVLQGDGVHRTSSADICEFIASFINGEWSHKIIPGAMRKLCTVRDLMLAGF